jgi:ribulose-5-phosphate 4-epimerase/fuculose-1-phosphate aldolase
MNSIGLHPPSRRELWRLLSAAALAAIARAQGSPNAALAADIVIANRILAAQGVVDAFGHVSARTAAGASRFLMSRSLAPAQVTQGDIVEYDLDGNAVSDKRAAYRERFIHSEIYRVRPDVMSIVHCHTASLIPFGISDAPLRPVYHNSSFVGEGVPVFDIHEAAGDTDMLVSSAALGRALAKSLADKPAVLMRGHGAVVVAKNLHDAVARAVYLDVNARVQAEAMRLGPNVHYLNPGEVAKRGSADEYGRAWDLWKSQVQGQIQRPSK